MQYVSLYAETSKNDDMASLLLQPGTPLVEFNHERQNRGFVMKQQEYQNILQYNPEILKFKSCAQKPNKNLTTSTSKQAKTPSKHKAKSLKHQTNDQTNHQKFKPTNQTNYQTIHQPTQSQTNHQTNQTDKQTNIQKHLAKPNKTEKHRNKHISSRQPNQIKQNNKKKQEQQQKNKRPFQSGPCCIASLFRQKTRWSPSAQPWRLVPTAPSGASVFGKYGGIWRKAF